MLYLIAKDIRLSMIWIAIGLLLGLTASSMIAGSMHSSAELGYLAVPVLIVSIPLFRIIYMEDNKNTRIFLKSIPEPLVMKVAARILYLFLLMIFVFGAMFVSKTWNQSTGLEAHGLLQLIIFTEGFCGYYLVLLSIHYRKPLSTVILWSIVGIGLLGGAMITMSCFAKEFTGTMLPCVLVVCIAAAADIVLCFVVYKCAKMKI